MSFAAWLLSTVFSVVLAMISAYMFAMFIYFITRLLVSFGGVSSANPVVQFILQVGTAIIEPVLRPIRRFVPELNGIDLSVIVLWLFLMVLSSFLRDFLLAMLLDAMSPPLI